MEEKLKRKVLAVTICTLLLMPEGTEVVKQLILAAWAGGESVADLRTLLAGQRVPAIRLRRTGACPSQNFH